MGRGYAPPAGGHQHRTRPCVDTKEVVAGRHPNETVKLNGPKLLWAQVLEAALADDLGVAALEGLETRPAWLEQHFPAPDGLLRQLFGGPDLLTLTRTMPHPGVWGPSL